LLKEHNRPMILLNHLRATGNKVAVALAGATLLTLGAVTPALAAPDLSVWENGNGTMPRDAIADVRTLAEADLSAACPSHHLTNLRILNYHFYSDGVEFVSNAQVAASCEE
jgi:hypothetical protein